MNSTHGANGVGHSTGLPRLLTGVFSSDDVRMRNFGIFESDLTIDFRGERTPFLITRILEQCSVDPDGLLPSGYFRKLTVGRRLECLLTLAAGEDGSAFNFPFHCSGCGQEIELELTLEEIAEQQRESEESESIEVEIKGVSYAFRKPCGADQEGWAEMVFQGEGEAIQAMIASLALAADFPGITEPGSVDRIDEALYESDPLVNFHCRVTCAECNSSNEFVVDLCDVALGMLGRRQQQLLVMVHKLASHYHWNEKEIFSIPHWRRKEYLSLIATGR